MFYVEIWPRDGARNPSRRPTPLGSRRRDLWLVERCFTSIYSTILDSRRGVRMFLRYCFILGRYKNDLAPENCFKKRPGGVKCVLRLWLYFERVFLFWCNLPYRMCISRYWTSLMQNWDSEKWYTVVKGVVKNQKYFNGGCILQTMKGLVPLRTPKRPIPLPFLNCSWSS